jgi:RNA polymerase sigma factor (sigma-70 family)
MASMIETTCLNSLAEQIQRGPRRLRLRQLGGIDFLLSVVVDEKAYPFDFVRHTITGYRQPAGERSVQDNAEIDGGVLRRELITMAEELSESANLSLSHWQSSVYSAAELADRFGVSTKTIFRWRKRGLVGWKFIGEDRRHRLAFPDHCVRRFVAENADLVSRGSNFSQLTKAERASVIERAQALVEAGEKTVNAVAKIISAESGRAIETIRLLLKHYDEAHPRTGLFNRPAIDVPADDHRLAIWEAHVDGAGIAALARRFDRPEKTIYAIITEMRARHWQAERIEFIDSEEFRLDDADDLILSDDDAAAPYDASTRVPRIPRGLPSYLQQLFHVPLLTKEGERALFRKMNYLKFKADVARQALDPESVTASQLDRIEHLLEQAQAVKNQIVQSNLRLVVSIAKRHAGPQQDFFEVVSDGNVSLMRAVDRFDYSRGFKFSTYASWAIIKNYARSLPEQRHHYDRYQTGREELLGVVPSPFGVETDNDFQYTVRRRLDEMLDTLDDRSQTILRQRYGLEQGGEPQTLEQIGTRFGVSKERIRQLEAKAMSKLRDNFGEMAQKVFGS